MTEEIIIDGVNVAGCEYCVENPLRDIKYSCNCRGYEKDNGLHIHLKCENNPNCYYKQLQRLKQEEQYLKQCCIKAGKELAKHSFEWDGKEKNLVVQAMELNQKYEALKQENEELKKENRYYKSELKHSCNELDKSNKWQVAERKEKNNYRKALEEIREMFPNEVTWVGQLTKLEHSIYNKINEVLQ